VSGDERGSEAAAAAARGVVGAMAMTGRVPVDHAAATELVHWAFGAAAGAVFGALPAVVRRPAWAGPVYGLVVWVGFEMTLAPLLGFPHARRRKILGRVAVAADHALYGAVVGGRLR
jgi:hypothetical protein